MTARPVFPISSLVGLFVLAGCTSPQGAGLAMGAVGAVAGGGGLNPLSAAIGLGTMAAADSAAASQAGVITPQEQAKYAGMSCAELRQLTANYAAAQGARPAAKKYGGMAPAGKMAIANQVISTRLTYLKQLVASKGC
ncbi:hypothetical protein FJW07_17825 [Mesorhizobium sp. B3-1-9]|uniref:hypothetical protein n=1 Tax=Mesorhizobium sp. B3-1-9 TaxID=2589892 RepID=UPI00112D858F|nr:hypothetical protein [Mesorhizobium sp. B3-1-9]TPI37631.1 hypothetical protein FJW07_17825 [Mesorhizobium sp. B3-1-9]